MLHDNTAAELQITGLGLVSARVDAVASGAAFYEISLSRASVLVANANLASTR